MESRAGVFGLMELLKLVEEVADHVKTSRAMVQVGLHFFDCKALT